MYRIDVIYDLELESLFEETDLGYEAKTEKTKVRNVKISDEIFDFMLHEGLIEKTEDGYVFIGKYEDTLEIKKKKH
jgi:hypothetical protein